MTKEEIVQGLYRGDSKAIKEAIKALEQQKPMEKFENAKDHIRKLAGDYKCYDNRLTDEEALELCHILEQQPSDDCVSRQAVEKAVDNTIAEYIPTFIGRYEKIPLELALAIKDVPPVTPTHGTCKDCKHWKDSDGVYRRGVNAESKCSINNSRVFDGTFYCADFEKRGDLDGSN